MRGAFVMYLSLSKAVNFVIIPKCGIIWHMLVSVNLLIIRKIRSLSFITVIFVVKLALF